MVDWFDRLLIFLSLCVSAIESYRGEWMGAVMWLALCAVVIDNCRLRQRIGEEQREYNFAMRELFERELERIKGGAEHE